MGLIGLGRYVGFDRLACPGVGAGAGLITRAHLALARRLLPAAGRGASLASRPGAGIGTTSITGLAGDLAALITLAAGTDNAVTGRGNGSAHFRAHLTLALNRDIGLDGHRALDLGFTLCLALTSTAEHQTHRTEQDKDLLHVTYLQRIRVMSQCGPRHGSGRSDP